MVALGIIAAFAAIQLEASATTRDMAAAMYDKDMVAFEKACRQHATRLEDGKKPIHWAVRFNWVDAVKKLIDQGEDVNVRTIEGITPLMEAAALGRFEAAEYLLKRGANVNDRDLFGRTVLHKTVEQGWAHGPNIEMYEQQAKVIRVLVKAGAALDASDRTKAELGLPGIGRTPLMMALQNWLDPQVAELLKLGARVDTMDEGGCTPLMYVPAWVPNDDPTVKLVLERKPPMTFFDAIRFGRRDIALQLAKRADLRPYRDIEGRSLVGAAAAVSDLEIVKILIAGGQAEQTDLLYATGVSWHWRGLGTEYAYNNHPDRLRVVRALLEAGISPNFVGYEGSPFHRKTAFGLAFIAAPFEMVKLMLAHGGDPNTLRGRPIGLYDPKFYAKSDLLIDHGLTVTESDLDVSPENLVRTKEILQRLIAAKGALVPGDNFSTMGQAEPEMLELLQKAGADVNWGYGRALSGAAARGSMAAVRWLLEHGADPTLQPRGQLLPADAARKGGHHEVADFIDRWKKQQCEPDHPRAQGT